MRLRASLLAVVMCAGALVAAAQDPANSAAQQGQTTAPIERRHPAPGDPDQSIGTIRVESRLVNVAVNVVDERGAPVSGLKREDFEVLEDGNVQAVRSFEAESATPLSIVIAVDCSESVFSMKSLERDAVKGFLRSLLRPQDRVDLMSFSDEVNEIVGFTNDRSAIESGFGRIERGPSTAMYDAIYLASQQLAKARPVPDERRVVVLITDGENTTRHGSYDAAIEQAQRAGTLIYSLILVPVAADAGRNEGGEHALIQMSNDTGGKYFYIEEKHDLGEAFAHVSEDLRTQYALAYYAPQRTLNRGGLRQIRVRLKDPALAARYKLRYRMGYYADRQSSR